jgi:phage terminase Nu1 subunit (DNA packaging protein)
LGWLTETKGKNVQAIFTGKEKNRHWKRWDKKEIDFLKKNINKLTDNQCANFLNRTMY